MLIDNDERDNDRLENFVQGLTITDAQKVYGMIARRLNAITLMQQQVAMQAFTPGDRVAFHDKGLHIEGVVVRINLRTVSVITTDGRRWTVTPSYLQKL